MQQSKGCPACRTESSAYICAGCLTKLLILYRNQTASHANSLLPAARTSAKAGIAINKEHVRLEADHAAIRKDVTILRHGLKHIEQAITADKASIQLRRQAMASRRSSLHIARDALKAANANAVRSEQTLLPNLASLHANDTAIKQHLEIVYAELADTRRILLAELAEAFDIQAGPDTTTCSIAGLPVPELRALAALPKHQLNATVQSLLSFLKLAAFYLGIRLPFQTSGSHFKSTVRAVSGSPNATKFPKSYVLYGFSRSSSTDASKSVSTSKASSTSSTAANHAQSLQVGLQMLAYNVLYLVQGSQFPTGVHLAQSGSSILHTIGTLVNMADLGYADHVTTRERAVSLDAFLEAYPFAKFVQDLERGDREADSKAKRGTYIVVDDEAVKDIDPFVFDKPVKEEEGWDLL